jgi:hypothetical protein
MVEQNIISVALAKDLMAVVHNTPLGVQAVAEVLEEMVQTIMEKMVV